MKVDYSQFEHPHEWDNWFGTVRITDGASEKTVSAEIQTEEDFIPEASKKHLNPLSNAMPNIRKYWQNRFWNTIDLRRSAWGNPPADDPKYPEVKDSQQLRSMYTLKSIVIHDPDSSDPDSIGLLYDYTWDDEGMGIRMTGLHVDEIGIQGTQY